jgi:hypothetical protein
MRHAARIGTLLVGLTLALAACGGSGTATSAVTQAPTATSGGGGAATAAPAASVAPTQVSAGGGATGDACSLITAAEVAGVMGAADFTTEGSGDGAPFLYCNYSAAGESVVYMSYMTSGAGPVYGAYAGDAEAIQISGLGDAAVYTPGSGGVLFVRKGDAVVGLTVMTKLTQAENIELLKKLGAFAAGRM